MQFLLAILLGIQLAAAAPFADHSPASPAPASSPMAARYALPLPAQGAQPQGLTKRQRDSVKAALRRGATGTNTARSNRPSSYPHHGISNTGSQQTGYGSGMHANDNYGQTGYEPGSHSNGNYGTTAGSHASDNYGTGSTYKKSGHAGSPPPDYTGEFAPYSDTPDDTRHTSSPTVSRRTFHNADFSSAGPQPVPEPTDGQIDSSSQPESRSPKVGPPEWAVGGGDSDDMDAMDVAARGLSAKDASDDEDVEETANSTDYDAPVSEGENGYTPDVESGYHAPGEVDGVVADMDNAPDVTESEQ